MKRAAAILLILSSVLGGLLYWKLREQRLARLGPTGGSATIEGTDVLIMSKLAARVIDVKVDEGDAVRKGQVLVRLDCRDYEAMQAQAAAQVRAAEAAAQGMELAAKGAAKQVGMARAAVAAARAQRKATEVEQGAAQRAAKRLVHLKAAGAVSDQRLDLTQSKAHGLQFKLRATEAQIRAYRYQTGAAAAAKRAALARYQVALRQVEAARSVLDRAKIAVGECTITAPRSGFVQVRSIEPGEVVLPGGRLLTVVDISKVKARFYVPNRELAAVVPGKVVTLKADAYPNRTFTGRITVVSSEAEFTPRNVQTRSDRDRLVYAVQVELDNPKSLLRPGMPVEIQVKGTRGGK